MRRFELEPFLANIGKYSINSLGLVPPIVIAIVMSGLAGKYRLDTVKDVSVGAAPLDRVSQARLRELFSPECLVNQVWGMTETSCAACIFLYPEDDSTGSVGRMLPNLDAKYSITNLVNTWL